MCESPINSARILAVGRPDEQTSNTALSVLVLQLVYLNCEPVEAAVGLAVEFVVARAEFAATGWAAKPRVTEPRASKTPDKASIGLKVFTCIV